jgi:predicted nucleic acid-binding protein
MPGTARLEFVDTNVLLYAFDTTESDKHRTARSLLERLWQTRTGCLSVQVMQEFFVNATRKLRTPLNPGEARAVLEDYSLWIVQAPTPAEIIKATHFMETTNISFWDAMMVTSALELDCRVLWTEDLQHGQRFDRLEVRDPFR